MQLFVGLAATMATAVLGAYLPPTSGNINTVEARSEHSGDITFYNPGLGACGVSNHDGDLIGAVSKHVFDPETPGGNPNHNPLCGRSIVVRRDGREIRVILVDRCESCAPGDIDLSPTAFDALADRGAGRVHGSWDFA